MPHAAEAHTEAVTADELLRMPRGRVRRELVRGELRVMNPAGHWHGRVAMRIGARLDVYVEEHGLGTVYAAETGFRIGTDPDTVRAPDVAFVRRERAREVPDARGYWPGAPDLAVEVVSPDDTYAEVEEKVFDWLDAGCRMVVVVNPRKRTATVYRSPTDIAVVTEGGELNGGEVVPGWKLALRDLFA